MNRRIDWSRISAMVIGSGIGGYLCFYVVPSITATKAFFCWSGYVMGYIKCEYDNKKGKL